MNKVARQALGLVNALASHLEGGRLAEATFVLDQSRPLTNVQSLAIEQLAERLRRDWVTSRDISELAELHLVRSILVLRPDDVQILERRLALERRVGGPESISEAMADLHSAAPDNHALKSVVKRWNEEVLTAAAKGDSRRVFGLARRLGPWGGLEDMAFDQMMRSLATLGPVQRLADFAKAHASRPPGPATKNLLDWLSGRARECLVQGAVDDALVLETAVSVLDPSGDSLTGGFLDALIAGARPDENSADLLARAMTRSPDLGGRRADVVSALLAGLGQTLAPTANDVVRATQDSLEALCGDTDYSRVRALAAGLDATAPEAWLISLIHRMASQGEAGTTLSDYCVDWSDNVRAAMGEGDWARVWTSGRRLEAANGDTPSIRIAMLAAALQHPVEPADKIRIWLKSNARDFDPTTRQHLRILRSVSQAALAHAKVDPSKLVQLTDIVLDVAALTNEGLRDVDALIETASLAGCLDQIVDGTKVEGSWSAEKHSMVGLALLKLQRPLEAEAHFRRAISLGIKGQLAAAMESELEALSLRAVGAAAWPGEDGTVVIESRASEALVGKALELCPRVYVLAWADIDPGTDEEDTKDGIQDVADVAVEDRIGTIPFRRIDIPPAADAARVLARWATELLVEGPIGSDLWVGRVKAYVEEIERILFLKLFPRMREVYNSIEAAGESSTRRTFIIWRSPAFRDVVVRGILSRHPEKELRVVCGAMQPAIRRTGQIHGRTPIAPGDGDEREILSAIGLPCKPAIEQFDPHRATCWVVVPQARSDVLSTLLPLISDMSKTWRLEVIFIDDVEDPERFSVLFQNHAEPIFPQSSIKTICLKSIRVFSENEIGGSLQEGIGDNAYDSMPPVMGGVDVREEFAAALPAANRVFSSTVVVDEWLKGFLANSPPDAALFIHGSSVEQSLIAKRMEEWGVPTLWLQLMQHARDGTFVRPPSRHHLVIDQYSKALWREHVGVDERDVTVVGSLRIDQAIARVSDLSREMARVELGLHVNGEVILVATQTVSLWENVRLIEIAIRGASNIDDIAIVVKLHPGEPESRIESYEHVFAKTGFTGRFVVTKAYDTYRAIVASDVVVVQHSNVGIEAMLMDRPVVSVVTNGGRQGVFSLADHGFVEEIADADEATARIRSILTKPATREAAAVVRRAYLEAHPELIDGNTSQRIIDAIQLQMSLSQPKRSQT